MSHQHQLEVSADPLPLALEASQVSFDSGKEVGRGSFAIVYQGMYKEKKCAIKVFNNGVVQDLKVQEESQLASIIKHHPNVVLVHGLWYCNAGNALIGNQPALVMELCSTNLHSYLREKALKGRDVFEMGTKLEILRDIAAGMIFLHSEQIVHGNLSARNVLLKVNESEVVAKVAGFGQSRLVDPQILHPNPLTPERRDIMPPEVRDSQGPVKLTKAVDIFSYGCLIPHVATCVYPEPCSDPLGWCMGSYSIFVAWDPTQSLLHDLSTAIAHPVYIDFHAYHLICGIFSTVFFV